MLDGHSEHAPEPAPEVIMDSNGAYWRRYPEHLSMPPVSTDNEPLATPVAVYQFVGWECNDKAVSENAKLRKALAQIASGHTDETVAYTEPPFRLTRRRMRRVAREALAANVPLGDA